VTVDFTSFFLQAYGRPPFPFQRALAEGEALPDILTVPTGCGKTATVVLGWLWRRRFGGHRAASTPRRLVYTLPVRTLVEQTRDEVRRWAQQVAPGLRVHTLLGGAVEDDWQNWPDDDCVIIGTQDQLLSRALMRGYAMSPYLWPIHFGLLHNDAWWVFDETQLMGPGLSTSAQLEALRRDIGTALPCHSTWMSATNAPGRLATVDLRRHTLRPFGLTEEDRAHPVLAARLTARKRLEQLPASADIAAFVATERSMWCAGSGGS
jgi:CRISPR-associated endonuclease/helicase Cas3